MGTAVVILSSIDPELRDAATETLLRGLPHAVVLRYDPQGLIGCPTCVVHARARHTLAELAGRGVPHVIVALPPTMTPRPLALGVQYSRAPLLLATSATVVDAATLADDLLGPTLLADRGLSLGRDARTVAAALSRQLETADLLLTVGPVQPAAAALLDHIAGTTPTRSELSDLDAAAVFGRRRPPALSVRGDLRLAQPTGAADRDGVWTLDLCSPAALHPQRLQHQLRALTAGRVRGRGYFWLAGEAGVQYGWDCAGGRSRIEALDHWAEPPHTRLVVTGDDDSAARIAAAFRAALDQPEQSAQRPKISTECDTSV